MKRLKLVIYLAVTLILVAVLRDAGTFLIINEPPRQADAIIVLSGDRGARLQRGIQLYREGYAPYLLFTSSATGLERSVAIAEGVPVAADKYCPKIDGLSCP